jgi:NAD+ diphosphatase
MESRSDPRSSLSSPVFSGAAIDRAAELRHDPVQIAALLATTEPVAVIGDATSVLVAGDGTRLARTPWHGDPDDVILLGIEAGRPVLAVDLAELEGGLGALSTDGRRAEDRVRTMSLREAGTALSREESGLAAYLAALMNWHRRHRFCPVCGTETRMAEAGLSRRCPSCGASHFPRTDPVVIMTVASEAGLLMGSRSGWDPERYSVLAGFVASGETPEEAVVREVREESGIEAHDAVYVASQPWPFPSSLMLGFHARAEDGEPRPGGDGELSDVRWFPRAEVAQMQRGESALRLPPEVSIARLLIDAWVLGSSG